MDAALTKRVRTFLMEIPDRGHGTRFFLAVAGAYLTSLLAYPTNSLPVTPVPISLQVFSVMAAAALLGPFYGGLSQVIFVAIGLTGLPWYAGGGAGLQLSGATGGYLAGFVAAGGLVGFLTHQPDFRGEMWKVGIAMGVGLVVIYIFGAFHLAMVLKTTYRRTLEMGVMPFVIPDILTLAGAAWLGHWVYGSHWTTPKKNRRGL